MTAIDPQSPFAIEDPFGHDVDFCLKTYRQLKELLDKPELVEGVGKKANERNLSIKAI